MKVIQPFLRIYYRFRFQFLFWIFLFLGILHLSSGESVLDGFSWQTGYADSSVREGERLGFWDFHTHVADSQEERFQIRGKETALVEDERWGKVLEIRKGTDTENRAEGVVIRNSKKLSPEGALSLDAWIQPGEGMEEANLAYILDKKYLLGQEDVPKSNRGYQLMLRRVGKTKQFRLEAELGFDYESKRVRSTPFDLEPGEWQHVAFTYDGKGNAILYRNGFEVGRSYWEQLKAVAPSDYPLVIGDRYGSIYYPFIGRITNVHLAASPISFKPIPRVELSLSQSRTQFFRMEPHAVLKLSLSNYTGRSLRGAQIVLDGVLKEREIPVPPVGEMETITLEIPLDSTLRVGEYAGSLYLKSEQTESVTGSEIPYSFTVHPRINQDRMRVIMWGGGGSNLELLKEIGFTHFFVVSQWSTSPWIRFLKEEGIVQAREQLDKLPLYGLSGLATVNIGRNAPKEYWRTDLNGVINSKKSVDGLLPQVQEAAYKLGKFVADHFGDMPTLEGILINTETRDSTRPSFHETSYQEWAKHSSRELPQVVADRPRGIAYSQIADFPANRVVSSDFPILDYYRWFWKTGDGWNSLHRLVNKGVKEADRLGAPAIWSFFDPAVRAPSLYGSGGDVDYLNQWTYSYPSPLKIALAGDELLAMSRGRKGQEIMNMTQVIWYRTQTAPAPKGKIKLESLANWEKEQPDAKFITIAPDHLSEAFWLNLSLPVKGILYHGWGSLTDAKEGGYRGTNPETRERLKQLIHRVVKPYGPMLTQIPEGKKDVAFLESFTSQILAARGTYGWGNGWGADSYIITRHAGLLPRVLYEETLLEEGLDAYKVLFLMHCDVLTEDVVQHILDFQQKGGILVGDEFLTPAIQPDILIQSYRRTKVADVDKAVLLKKAKALRRELDPFYQRPFETRDPEVLLAWRSVGEADYLFTINDHRTYGDYVGHYKLVMEKGLPASTVVSVQGPRKVVYDLLGKKRISLKDEKHFDLQLDAGEGRIFLILPQPIGALSFQGNSVAERDQPYSVTVQLTDTQRKGIPAVIPMHIVVRDAEGRESEGTGYYGATGGVLNLTLDIAKNDSVGAWTIECVEGVTGKKEVFTFKVQ